MQSKRERESTVNQKFLDSLLYNSRSSHITIIDHLLTNLTFFRFYQFINKSFNRIHAICKRAGEKKMKSCRGKMVSLGSFL